MPQPPSPIIGTEPPLQFDAADAANVQNPQCRDEQLALLALQQIDGLGIAGLQALLGPAHSAQALLEQCPPGIVLDLLRPKTRRALAAFLRSPRSSAAWEIAEKTLLWLADHDAALLLKTDPRFPPLLREMADCPPCLYVQGDLDCFKMHSISIVGTRKPSGVGRQVAQRLGRDLAAAGFLVCSGMALGIDSQAHRGALESTGYTAAVWATGLDTIYPPSNLALAKSIRERGVLLTEMPLGTAPTPGLFPRRNRIVSALSLGVIVVEAGLPSGSLITANCAAEQNREVFAVPGSVNQSQCKGCHQLLRDGAHLVECVDDVLAVLGGFRSLVLPALAEDAPQASVAVELEPGLRKALAAIEAEPASFEVISRRSGMPAAELNRALVDLELGGLINVYAGQYSLGI